METNLPNPLREAPVTPPPIQPPTTRKIRITCATILAITLPIIVIAAWLHPDPKGSNSHTQLGLQPCGFYAITGVPCPTCGCTTAVTHVVHGQILSGLVTQPFGAVFGIVTVMAALLALIGLVTGRWYGPEPFWLQWHWRTLLFSTAGLVVLAWVYKILFVTTAHGW